MYTYFRNSKLIIRNSNANLPTCSQHTIDSQNSRGINKLNYFFYLFILVSFIFIANQASAERITICSKNEFSSQSGTACTFDTVPGEEIITSMSYRDEDDFRGGGYVEIKHNGAFMNGGWSSGTIRLHPPSQDSTLRRIITPEQRGRSWVSYSVHNHSTRPPDLVYIGVESERTNLSLGAPVIKSYSQI